MRTAIIKFYKVLINKRSDWYEIVLFIQRDKTSTMYIIKTRDKEILESLTSPCFREVTDTLYYITKIITGRIDKIKVAFYCQHFHIHNTIVHNKCPMTNYRKIYIL